MTDTPGVQDNLFAAGEGDQWYERNRAALSDERHQETDWPLRIIEESGVEPLRILEIGCSNGWRLAALHARFNSICVGVEPSVVAVEEGTTSFPVLDLRVGLSSDLPLESGEAFDVVIVNYVLHWVSRESLFKSIAEIDRAVSDGGFVVIGDFLPDAPTKTRYHHLPDEDVYTFKVDYAAAFTALATYSLLIRHAYDHDDSSSGPVVASGSRGGVSILRKSLTSYYGAG